MFVLAYLAKVLVFYFNLKPFTLELTTLFVPFAVVHHHQQHQQQHQHHQHQLNVPNVFENFQQKFILTITRQLFPANVYKKKKKI